MLPILQKDDLFPIRECFVNGILTADWSGLGGEKKKEKEEAFIQRLEDQLISRVSKYASVDIKFITDVCKKMRALHGNALRKSKDSLFVVHPLSAAISLADLHANSNIIAAALLHDTVEDTKYEICNISQEFNEFVASVVSAVTAVTPDTATSGGMTEQALHQYLDECSLHKLFNSVNNFEAILVKLADREHNLSTISAVTTEQQRDKAQNTLDILVPVARYLGIRYYETVLQDYCLQILEPDIYSSLRECRAEILRKNGPAMTSFYTNNFSPSTTENTSSQAKLGVFSLSTHTPLFNQNFRTVTPFEILIQSPGFRQTRCFKKQNVYLKEIVLTYESTVTDPFAVFFDMYINKMCPSGIYMSPRAPIFDGMAYRIILMDSFENNYCICLIPQDKIYAYYLGVAPEDVSEILKQAANTKQITVYSFNRATGKYRENHVAQNSTALDLAFALKPGMALCATGCYIRKDRSFDGKEKRVKLGAKLNPDDVVSFDTDFKDDTPEKSIYHATLDWFMDVTTPTAKGNLISYLKSSRK